MEAVAAPYYIPRDYGSDSLYSPFGNFLSYSLDSLQIPESFDTSNFNENLDTVLDELTHPRRAIDAEGGFNRFINRQVFPVDSEHSSDSWSMLPNYGLHLLGGGMVYRKDLEWFRAHDVDYAATIAITLSMTAELIQEVIEKRTTTSDDAVADFYIFRPLGIFLFHNDAFANAFMDAFDPAIWPYMQAFDFSTDLFMNTGINYVYRPPATEFHNTRLFIFTGLNNQLGLSHRINESEWFSWGVGVATQRVDFSLDKQAEVDTSFGIFYDRNKSLLWSLMINGTGGQRYRINLYPTNDSIPGSFGYYLGARNNNSLEAGFTYRIQMGAGFSM